MSIDEALDNYSLLSEPVSVGDNLNRICWRLYRSLDSKYIQILVSINVRFDWEYIKPGDNIQYFNKEVCDSIEL